MSLFDVVERILGDPLFLMGSFGLFWMLLMGPGADKDTFWEWLAPLIAIILIVAGIVLSVMSPVWYNGGW